MAPRDDWEAGSFLAQLTTDEFVALTSASARRQYRKGATLFNEGDVSDRVIALTEGRVKICYFTADGKEVVLAIRGPGDLVGELSAIDGQRLSATVTSLEPVSGFVMTSSVFTSFLSKTPRVALLLLQSVTGKLRDADRKRIEFSESDSVGRVAKRLVELAERFGTGESGSIDITLSQEELGGWTGASREAVSKALQSLRGRGWIETSRRAITIKDIDALKKRAT
ncbi:MAG: Crp/Fnr family transcriptional regulator [Actinomycetota bacterium]